MPAAGVVRNSVMAIEREALRRGPELAAAGSVLDTHTRRHVVMCHQRDAEAFIDAHALGVLGRAVFDVRVQRVALEGPLVDAVVTHNHGEVAHRQRELRRDQGPPRRFARRLAAGAILVGVAVEEIDRHAVAVDEAHAVGVADGVDADAARQ